MPARQRPPSAARDLIPAQPDLGELRAAAAGCTACDLYRDATQTVFGEGSPGAEVMLVGEQPGDGEDRAGRPFVGPAGRVLDQALAGAVVRAGAGAAADRLDHLVHQAGVHRQLLVGVAL